MATDGAFNPSTINAAANAAALAASQSPSAQTGILMDTTVARTAKMDDASEYVRFTNAGAVAYTIPPNSAVPFPINSAIDFEQAGAGAVTIVPGAGVTINTRGGVMSTAGQFAVGMLRKVGTDNWTLTGDLA